MLKLSLVVAFATVGTVLAAPVLAKETYVNPAPTEKLDPKDPNYMRCRKIQVTGSLVKKDRICKTNAEWAKAGEDAQKNADDLIGRNRTGTNLGN